MIDFLRGFIVHREADYVVIDVHGVGYRVFCANSHVVAISGKDNEETTLYIHHHVREDAILLFGFTSREEQWLFRRLIDVSGIGPKVAIGILSGGAPDAVIAAIQQEDVMFLTRLPGIGKKTAQRMILDLKDKLAGLPVSSAASAAVAGGAAAAQKATLAAGSGAWGEAKQALLALGYSEAEADRVGATVKSAAPEGASVDALLKLALQVLYKG
jgi:Holliday junction DNA helicase RuvA